MSELLSFTLLTFSAIFFVVDPFAVIPMYLAIIPLGIPMLAGPGSIATVMMLMSKAGSIDRVGIVIACIFATGVLTFVVLRGATMLERTLRRTGLNIINRVMGLILAAVAVQF